MSLAPTTTDLPYAARPADPATDPATVARRLARSPSRWQPSVAFDPAERFYTRLLDDAGVEAWLLTWLPGQGTDWHDHGGSAGAFVVVSGTLTERSAALRPDGSAVPAVRRELGPDAVRPFGRRHVHRVTNEGTEPAVSLHVYAPALVRMHRYAVADGALRLVATERAGASW